MRGFFLLEIIVVVGFLSFVLPTSTRLAVSWKHQATRLISDFQTIRTAQNQLETVLATPDYRSKHLTVDSFSSELNIVSFRLSDAKHLMVIVPAN